MTVPEQLDNPRGPHTLVTHPEDASRVYVVFESSGIDEHMVSSTENGGLTWNEFSFHSGCMYQAIAVDRQLEHAYLVNDEECVTDITFMKTNNGGESWMQIGQNLPASDPISISSYPTVSGKIFLGTDKRGTAQGVHKSTNAGLEWTRVGLIDNRITSFTIDNLNNSIIYAGVEESNSGVYKSTDDGYNWVGMNSGLTYPSVVALTSDPEEPSIIYTATRSGGPPGPWEGHCYVSVDGARQWIELPQIPNNRYIYDLQIDYDQPDKLYVVTFEFYEGVVGFIPNGLFTYTPTWQFKSLISSSPEATFANNGRKLLHVYATNELWVAYESGGVIYAVHSTDNGENWSRKMEVGEGYTPAIAIRDVPDYPPCLVWLAKNEQDTIYFARYLGEDRWTEPAPIVVSQSGVDFGPPSFVVGDYNIGHLVHSDASSCYYVNFYVYDPTNPSTPELIGSGTNPGIGFMSSAVYPTLHVVLEDNGIIYYSARVSGSWTREIVSTDDYIALANCHHPALTVEGSVVYVAWDGDLNGVKDIWWRHVTYIESGHEWSWIWPVCQTDNFSGYPVLTTGYFCSWVEQEGSDYEIYYARYDPMLWTWRDQTNISNSPDKYSLFPHLAHKQTVEGTDIYFIWTENSQPPFDIKFVTVPIGGGGDEVLPFYAAKGGEKIPSPFNLRRDGFKQFGSEAYKKVDYASDYLEYRFERLNPDREYALTAYAYQHGYNNLPLTVKVDDVLIGGVVILPDTLIKFKKMLPHNLYCDSVIDIKIFSLCATLVLAEYEKSSGEGGPQDAFISPFNSNVPVLKVYPNPSSEKINIRYTIHDAGCMTYNIKIYDATGRLVRQWDYETMRQSD